MICAKVDTLRVGYSVIDSNDVIAGNDINIPH